MEKKVSFFYFYKINFLILNLIYKIKSQQKKFIISYII